MNVIVSHQAEKRLDQIIAYLEENWGYKVKEHFLQHFSSVVSNLKNYPYLFPESDIKEGVRRCVLTEQTSLYYRVNNDVIEMITLQDSRQNPDNLKF